MGGGEGERVRPFIHRWLGHTKPKQFCSFVGTRSLFQHTLDRAATLSPAGHIVTVVAREHRPEAWPQLQGRTVGSVLLQPKNRGTAAEVYLALTYIRTRASQTTVVIYPSDHFVYPEHRFLSHVHRAAWTTEWLPNRLIYLGACPDHLELEHEWITLGKRLDGSRMYQIHGVDSFLEEITVDQADGALARGALWNTSVLAVKTELLWELGLQYFPDLMPRFERLSHAIGTSHEGRTLDEIYSDMPSYNLSSVLLGRAPERAAVVEMNGVLWNNWSRPERITRSLRQIRRQPAFPLGCLSRPFAPIALGAEQ